MGVPADRLGRLHSNQAAILQSDGRVTAEDVSLRYLIWNAYGVQGYQVVGGADWIDSDGYDTTFTADTTGASMQAFLEDNFQLKVHREAQRFPLYNLVVQGKVKLPKSRVASCAPDDPAAVAAGDKL